jgi:hypothetical protein
MLDRALRKVDWMRVVVRAEGGIVASVWLSYVQAAGL